MSTQETIDTLLAFGFREYPANPHDRESRHWQYLSRDEHGKRFYVQVRYWNFPLNEEIHEAFDAWAQFNTRGERTFEVTLICAKGMTPQEIFEWFDRIFTLMECQYYERDEVTA